MPKKSRQKFQYLENEKSFWDELKSIFLQFWRAIIIIDANIKFFFGRWESDFNGELLLLYLELVIIQMSAVCLYRLAIMPFHAEY